MVLSYLIASGYISYLQFELVLFPDSFFEIKRTNFLGKGYKHPSFHMSIGYLEYTLLH